MRKAPAISGLMTMLVFVLVALLTSAQNAAAQQITLSPFSTPFNNPIGIDHHEPSDALILSVNYPNGVPNNLDIINETNGAHTQFSSLSGLTEELKIATVRTSPACQQFPVGDVFTGNGQPGQIVRLDKNGNIYPPAPNNPGNPAPGFNSWVQLPAVIAGVFTTLPQDLLRGSLFVDRGCGFSGDLIVVTSDGTAFPTNGAGAVWRVKSDGTAQFLTRILRTGTTCVRGNCPGVHLEGVITLPNDINKYGAPPTGWAGTIIAGDENDNLDLTKNGRIWSITAAGVATPFTLAFTDGNGLRHPIKTEDLDIIEAGADFFGVDYGDSRILTAPSANFAGFVGDILLTQEFPCGSPGFPPGLPTTPCVGTNGSTSTPGLYVVQFVGSGGNAVGGVFNVTPLTFFASSFKPVRQWEHVTISPRGDVGVLKSAFQSPINAGDIARFDITVTANGPAPSLNVVLTDTVPTGVDGLGWSVTGPDGTSCSPNPVAGGALLTCNFGTLKPGEVRTITLTAKTTAGACPSLANTATVNSTNDRNSANNSSTATITINSSSPGCTSSGKPLDIGPFGKGDLIVPVGDWISAGYRFKFPTNNDAGTVSILNATMTLPVRCSHDGPVVGNIVIPLASGPYSVPMNYNKYLPAESAADPASYQGAVKAPPLCGAGNPLFLTAYSSKIGAVFHAVAVKTIPQKLQIAVHYNSPAGRGKQDINCMDPTANPPPGNSACGASWSGSIDP
jgi:uncharacterized repeat protein (TIGR01451 family)